MRSWQPGSRETAPVLCGPGRPGPANKEWRFQVSQGETHAAKHLFV